MKCNALWDAVSHVVQGALAAHCTFWQVLYVMSMDIHSDRKCTYCVHNAYCILKKALGSLLPPAAGALHYNRNIKLCFDLKYITVKPCLRSIGQNVQEKK